MQAKQHKHVKKQGKKWSVTSKKLPVPTIALAKSIENYESPIYKISDYINVFSNRPYAIDHASGTRYNRGETNFDIVDAVVNLSGKAKIKEEDFVKFIFYSEEFNYENAKSYFETKIRQMSCDIGEPWNLLDKRAYVKHDFKMSSSTHAQKKLDDKFNKDMFNYTKNMDQ